MKTETYLNGPLRSCRMCAYRERGLFGDECTRSGFLCRIERRFVTLPGAQCDINFSGWAPRPPRRSLRRWLLNLLWT